MPQNQLSVFKSVVSAPEIQRKVKASMGDGAGAFIASLLDLYESESSLHQCDPQKVAMECVKAAALKLPLVKSLGFAYVVPFKKVPTFMVGYKGLIQLAQRTGQYRTINSDVVYEGELAGYDKLSGEIRLDGVRKSDKAIGYFAFFETVSGFRKILYMSKEQVESWAKRYSPSYGSSYSPWKTEFDKMALKTCLRRLISTYGVMSTELQTAIVDDPESRAIRAQEEAEDEIQQKANATPIDTADEPEVVDYVDEETGEVVEEEAPGF
jgi:recombination protein RecT